LKLIDTSISSFSVFLPIWSIHVVLNSDPILWSPLRHGDINSDQSRSSLLWKLLVSVSVSMSEDIGTNYGESVPRLNNIFRLGRVYSWLTITFVTVKTGLISVKYYVSISGHPGKNYLA
jgi:hypothetical protein